MATTTGVDIVVKVLGDNNIRKLDTQLKGLDKTSQATGKNVSVASKGAKGLGTAAGGAVPSVQGLGAALSSALGPLLAVSTAVAAVGKAIGTAFERDVAEKRLQNLTKSTGEYEAALAYAQVAANKFKTTQTESTKAIGDAYSRLNGLGFGLKEVTTVYDGFNTIAREAGVSTEDASGAFLQLSQAMGSGVLQGDELRSILERMPQLAVAIAKEMGVSATQIKSLGSEGKITSEVLYNTFANMGEGVTDFGSKMTDAQRSMADFRAAAENAFNAFGEMITPVIAPALEFVTGLVQGLADWWEYLADQIFPKVKEAFQPVIDALSRLFEGFDWNALGTFFANTADVIINELLWGFKQLVPVIVGVIDLIKAAFDTPLIQGFVTVLGSVADALGLTGDKVGDWKKEQEAATQAAAKSVDAYSKLPPKVISSKEAAKSLKEQHKQITNELKAQLDIIGRVVDAKKTALDNEFELEQSLRDLRKTINEGEIESLKVKQDKSKSLQDQILYEKQIYQLTKDNIQIEYQGAIAAIEQQRAQNQLELVKLERRKAAVEMAVAEATALGTATTEMRRQLDVAQQIYDDQVAQSGVVDSILQAQTDIAVELRNQQLAQAAVARDAGIKALKEQATETAAIGAAGAMERQATASATLVKNLAIAAKEMSSIASGFSQMNAASQGIGAVSFGSSKRIGSGKFTQEERKKAAEDAARQMGVLRTDEFGVNIIDTSMKTKIMSYEGHVSFMRKLKALEIENLEAISRNKYEKALADKRKEQVMSSTDSVDAAAQSRQQEEIKMTEELATLKRKEAEASRGVTQESQKQIKLQETLVAIKKRLGQDITGDVKRLGEIAARAGQAASGTAGQLLSSTEAMAKEVKDLMIQYSRKRQEDETRRSMLGSSSWEQGRAKHHQYAGAGRTNAVNASGGFGAPVINFSGSTLSFNDNEWVSKDDVTRLMNEAFALQQRRQAKNATMRLMGAY